jgi:NTE family protein
MGEGADADLASYLMFDGTFAKKLIDLGRADARAQRDELAAFLFDAEEQAEASRA